eukprot:g1146.t1
MMNQQALQQAIAQMQAARGGQQSKKVVELYGWKDAKRNAKLLGGFVLAVLTLKFTVGLFTSSPTATTAE